MSVCQMLGVLQASARGRNFSSIAWNRQPRRIQHGQFARGDFLLRLLMIAPREQFGDGNLAGDFRQTHDVIVGRSLLLNFLRKFVPFLVKARLAIREIEINRSAIHVEKRELFNQLLLFGSPFIGSRLSRRACQWLLCNRQLLKFSFEGIIDDAIQFRVAFLRDVRQFGINRRSCGPRL